MMQIGCDSASMVASLSEIFSGSLLLSLKGSLDAFSEDGTIIWCCVNAAD